MDLKIVIVAALPVAAAVLAGCSTPGATPIQTSPYSGCAIAQTGHQPGEIQTDRTTVPESLTITCNGVPTTLQGDFTSRTTSSYDVGSTGVDSVVAVGGEVRIWHHLRSDRACLTIQRLDEPLPSRDTCQTPDDRAEDQKALTV